jgi:hypothetical protein
MRRFSRQAAAAYLAELGARMTGARLFESWTLAAPWRPPLEMKAEVRSETAEGVIWVLGRYIDGWRRSDWSWSRK